MRLPESLDGLSGRQAVSIITSDPDRPHALLSSWYRPESAAGGGNELQDALRGSGTDATLAFPRRPRAHVSWSLRNPGEAYVSSPFDGYFHPVA